MSEANIRRGQDANRILAEPVLKEALAQMYRDITDQWGQVPVRDVEGREHCWRLFKSMENFEALLKSYVESGKADEAMLKRQQTPLEVLKGAIGL